jgi:uncharacterized linocin/CFP29 family protein
MDKANTEMFKALVSKGGSMAQKLMASGMNINKALRTNATLRKDEWKQYDTAVLKIATERLVGVKYLMSKGLTYRTNGLGKTVLEYEDASDMEAAQVSMDGVTRGRSDRVEFDMNYLPLPITHSNFQLSIRTLNASRTTGESLDTTMAEMAARKVAEKTEEMLFTGQSDLLYASGGIYGLTTVSTRNTGSLTANWDDSAASGSTVLADVLAMKQASLDDKHYGPFVLFVPGNFETALDDEFKANSDKSIRTRLSEIGSISDIIVADKLTDDNVVLCELQPETIRMVEGLPLTTVEWQTHGDMLFHFKVMQILVPQPRADQDDTSGISHWS